MATRKCKRHPYYRGIRKPRARDADTGQLCADCLEIYNELQNSGFKEKRERKPRNKAKVVKEEVATEQVEKVEQVEEPVADPVTSFNPQVDSLNDPVVEEQTKCEPCVSDEELDEIEDEVFDELDDEDWDEELDDDEFLDDELEE
jgi:hypothetical protein